jgi:hypothetical protein
MEIEGTLEGVQPYTIHGLPWFRAFFTHAGDPDTIHQAQLPDDAFDAALRPGDPITVTYLLKTVMEIRRRSDQASGA